MRRKALLAIAGLAAWVVGSALGSSGAPAHRVAAAPLNRVAAAPVFTIGRAHPHEVRNIPSLSGDKPIFILALGSDARPGQSVFTARSDSIHIIGIDPQEHRASVLGFPRDSWVDIPGHGSNKINAAMVYGGPALAVDTVEHLTGIHLDYYLLTSFGGLVRMVDMIGGLEVNVPYSMHDPYSGANFNAGRQKLTGRQALAFSRNRHDAPLGDFSRSENQGRLFLAALAQFREEFAKDPSVLLSWIAAGVKNVRTDLSISELVSLAFASVEISPSSVKNVVVPGTTGSAGDASVVFISGAARSIYADMRRDGLIGH